MPPPPLKNGRVNLLSARSGRVEAQVRAAAECWSWRSSVAEVDWVTPGVCVGGRRYAVWSHRRRNIFVASRSNGQLFVRERSFWGVCAGRGMSGFAIGRAFGLTSYSDYRKKKVFGLEQVVV